MPRSDPQSKANYRLRSESNRGSKPALPHQLSIFRVIPDHRLAPVSRGVRAAAHARQLVLREKNPLPRKLQSLPNPHGLAKYAVVLTQGFIRVLAVLVQTVACRQADSANAPFAFVTGLLLTGLSPLVSLFSLAVAIPAAMGSRVPAAFFPVLAIAHLGFGFWFNGQGAIVGLGFGAVAAILPLVWALAFRRELVITYRAKRTKEDSPPEPLR
jgi:hypothetical protein